MNALADGPLNGVGQLKSSTFRDAASKGDPFGIWVQRTFARFKAYRRNFDRDWYRFQNLWAGKHWEGVGTGVSDFWKSRLVVNYTRAIIQTIVAVALDNDPKLSCSASHPNQQEYASGLQACIESLWARGEITCELKDAFTNACKVGTGYVICYWDPTAEEGQGEIVVKELPSECVYPQPGARRISECDQFMILRRESAAWIEKYWPEKLHLCRPAMSGELDRYSRNRQDSAYGQYGSSFYLDGPLAGGYGFGGDDPTLIDKSEFGNPPYSTRYGADERYDILEVYIKDDSIVETVEEVVIPRIQIDSFGNRYVVNETHHITKSEKRFKTGWRHAFVCGDVTLEDDESPYPCIPVVKLVDESEADEFFGTGEPQQLEALQHELNKRRSQMIDHATLNGGAVWLVNREAKITKEDLNNRPGQIIQYRIQGNEVPIKREPGVPMPSFYMQMVEMTIRDMREISGVSSIPGGSPPKGARSGAAFEAAMQTATQRIRMRTHNLEQAIRELGRIIIKFIQHFYTELRWVRVVGHTGFQGHIPFNGQWIRGDWDILVIAGSTMNMSQSAREQRDLELFKLKAIDQPALLQGINYPGWQEVCKRMESHIPPEMKEYYGYPAQPDRDSTSSTGYAFSVRSAPQPFSTPGAPPPGGQMPGLPNAAAPVGGNPGFNPQQMQGG